MSKMESISSLSPEDISLKDPSKENEVFYKESDTENQGKAFNSGIAVLKESLILQALEDIGVKGVPRVIRLENGMPLSRSGHVTKGTSEDGYTFTSIGIERIEGEDWEKHKFKNEKDLIHASLKAAEILKEVYDAGFVHEDIKPSNLMINKDGEVTLIDLNAAQKHDREGVSYSNVVTMLYAAPERSDFPSSSEEALRKYHVSGDIYSFAVTIAEKAGIDVGVLVDEGIAPELRREKFLENVQTEIGKGKISPKLGIFIMWNTSSKPEHRNQNFDEVIDILKMVQDEDVLPQKVADTFVEGFKKRQ